MRDISNKILRDFRSGIAASPKIRALAKKNSKGKATYLDADNYALGLSQALVGALSHRLMAIFGNEYKGIMAETLPPGLKYIHTDVGNYARTVQSYINRSSGVGLNAIKAVMDPEKVREIIRTALSVDNYADIKGRLDADIRNFAQNAGTETMKANAKLYNDVGFEVYVDRTYDDVGVHNRRDECEWCLDRVGHWTYADALANGVFERHPGCGCEIIYTRDGQSQRQTNWRNNEWSDV